MPVPYANISTALVPFGLVGGVISVGRAEAKQRLREQARAAGWQDVLNVRIDTAEMTPPSNPKGTKAVEIFAYGTGIKFG